jgi:hypothetical protein
MKTPLPLTVWSPVGPKKVFCPGMVPTTVTTDDLTFWTAWVMVVWISVVLTTRVCS